jgi:hypothetical protein
MGMNIACSVQAGFDAGNRLFAFVVLEVLGTGSFAEHQDIAVGVSEAADIDGVVGSYLAVLPVHTAEAACQRMVLPLGGLQDGLGSDTKEFPVVQFYQLGMGVGVHDDSSVLFHLPYRGRI